MGIGSSAGEITLTDTEEKNVYQGLFANRKYKEYFKDYGRC